MSAKRCKSQTPDSAEWVEIPGYRFRYQINREAVVRKELESGEWYVLKPYISGRTRACVKMRTADNRKVDVPVVWLMADAFMGGRRTGYNIIHRNGAKMDCELVNLSFASKQQNLQRKPAQGCDEGRSGRSSGCHLLVGTRGGQEELHQSKRHLGQMRG